MEKLTIEINCNKRTCGKCKQRIIGKGVVCSIFVTHLNLTEKGQKRLPECIEACKGESLDVYDLSLLKKNKQWGKKDFPNLGRETEKDFDRLLGAKEGKK
ncbi:MAG: hypothetical protein LBU85_09115 [Treponema sp.]|jgi:hypothetical protein|nr:hypothetical protein [Treponema sp.]